MVHITMVGVKAAKEGVEFVYMGTAEECKGCKLLNVCSNLEAKRAYKVVKARDAVHECPVHEDGVRAVEVEVVPFEAAIQARTVMEGSLTAYAPVDCDHIGCKHFRACRPLGAGSEGKKRVLVSRGAIDCPRGLTLRLVILE